MKVDPKRVTLVSPDNDTESRQILLLAYRMGMAVIRSGQGLGASLDHEHGIISLIVATGRPNVWIVEMPGLVTEEHLSSIGFNLTIIDHHDYRNLQRSRTPEGKLLPSSLEQFLNLTGVTDDQLLTWEMDPMIVRGIGIMDGLYAQGLRKAGYTQAMIREIIRRREDFQREFDPNFQQAKNAAMRVWCNRTVSSGIIVVYNSHCFQVAKHIGTITIHEGCDQQTMIISDMGGHEIQVINVTPNEMSVLQAHFSGYTFTYGSGRCWGVNNPKGNTQYNAHQVLAVLQAHRS